MSGYLTQIFAAGSLYGNKKDSREFFFFVSKRLDLLIIFLVPFGKILLLIKHNMVFSEKKRLFTVPINCCKEANIHSAIRFLARLYYSVGHKNK